MMNIMSTERTEVDLPEVLATTLLANLGAFQSFARSRLRDEQLAADAVQESLLRALKASGKLSHDQNLVAWFYRILRNVLADLQRQRSREGEALAEFAEEMGVRDRDDALEDVACRCLRGLLDTLPNDYSRVIELADLRSQPLEIVANEIGISKNNAKVRLHRARRKLRDRLIQTCGICSKHGCLDCTCNE
jgi:RNA polymerase sigma factor (sigma-70 family)